MPKRDTVRSSSFVDDSRRHPARLAERRENCCSFIGYLSDGYRRSESSDAGPAAMSADPRRCLAGSWPGRSCEVRQWPRSLHSSPGSSSIRRRHVAASVREPAHQVWGARARSANPACRRTWIRHGAGGGGGGRAALTVQCDHELLDACSMRHRSILGVDPVRWSSSL